jgi:ATP-dependent Clp protease protease subunit
MALPNSRVLIHQPHGETGPGQTVDIAIRAEEMLKHRDMMNEILARHTGKPIDDIARDTDRDFIMSAEQARDYGMIDTIVEPRKVGPLGEFTPAAATGGNGSKR